MVDFNRDDVRDVRGKDKIKIETPAEVRNREQMKLMEATEEGRNSAVLCANSCVVAKTVLGDQEFSKNVRIQGQNQSVKKLMSEEKKKVVDFIRRYEKSIFDVFSLTSKDKGRGFGLLVSTNIGSAIRGVYQNESVLVYKSLNNVHANVSRRAAGDDDLLNVLFINYKNAYMAMLSFESKNMSYLKNKMDRLVIDYVSRVAGSILTEEMITVLMDDVYALFKQYEFTNATIDKLLHYERPETDSIDVLKQKIMTVVNLFIARIRRE